MNGTQTRRVISAIRGQAHKVASFMLAMLLCSCATDKEFTIYNAGEDTLTDVGIYSDSGFSFTWGILSPAALKGMLVTDEHPLKDNYTLCWIKNGTFQTRRIDLKQELPFWFVNGKVIFQVNDNKSVDVFYGPNAYENSVRKDRRARGMIP
jgi:hypothetical protein